MKRISCFLFAFICALLAMPTFAEDSDGWFLRPYAGLSQMSDIGADFTDINALSGRADITMDSGFTAGLGFGYQYNNHFAVEVAWEYRSNESEVDLAGQDQFPEGNYASNLFFLNGHYFFNRSGKWQPYLGAGFSWAQEIDIDLEQSGLEQSYSGSGDIGYQIFAGINYHFQNGWSLQPELRYGSITGIDLSGESAAGEFTNLDYQPLTIQIGIVYGL